MESKKAFWAGGNRNSWRLPALAILASLLCLGLEGRLSAQDTTADTLTTPFKKGRWLSGLSGSFNSNSLRLESEEGKLTTSSYGMEIFTGSFFRDRWFVGFNLLAFRAGSAGLIERKSESLLIGPSVSHYFLNEPYGSLYLSVLPGYIRIREESSITQEGVILTQLAEGPGFSTRIRMGYSYVISQRIILDVGVGANLSWLTVTYDSELEAIRRKESIFSNATFFSFGFNVLLDEFFF